MRLNFLGKSSIAAATIASVVIGLMLLLQALKVTEESIFKGWIELRKTFNLEFPDNWLMREVDYLLVKRINEDPVLLAFKVQREVDSAVWEYLTLTGQAEGAKIDSPVFTEVTQGETALGGELRLTSPWKTDNPTSNNNEL